MLPRFNMTLLAAGAVMIPWAVWADEHARPHSIEIFTTAQLPIEVGEGVLQVVQIYRVDALQLLDAELSRNLPRIPEDASRVALARIGALAGDFGIRVEAGARGIVLAHQYQITKVPAVVFDDGESVVYGVLDLAEAIKIYRRHQGG